MCNLKSQMPLTRIAFPLAVVALVVGHFAPWAQPAAAALTLSAHELAIFTNYTPYAGVFFNEGYLLPLWAAALMCAAGARRRFLPAALAALLWLLALPGYPELRNLTSGQGSEFMLQLVTCVVFLPLGVWLGGRTNPGPVVLRAAAGAGLLAALTSTVGFLVVRAVAIEPLFGVPVALGWGWWCTVAGAVLCLAAIAFAGSLHSRP